jgi:hypothetical protein
MASSTVRVFPSTDRIDPHKHTIQCEKLLVHFVGEFLVKHRRVGANADHREFFEDPVIAIMLWRRGSSRLAIAAPENCDSIGHCFDSWNCVGCTGACHPC